jgi:hypothetical protein
MRSGVPETNRSMGGLTSEKEKRIWLFWLVVLKDLVKQ